MDEIKRGQESVAKSTDKYAITIDGCLLWKEPQIREKFMKTGQNINDKSLNVYRNVK